MKFNEAINLYKENKDEKALNALKEFFEYNNNNNKILHCICDCYINLKLYDEALQYIIPKIDGKEICHTFYSGKICIIIKARFEIANLEEKLSLLKLLKFLWKDSQENEIKYLSEYGILSRKVDCQQEFLNEIENLKDEKIIKNQYIVRSKCWCLYDLNIKSFNISDKNNEEICEFLDSAKWIIENCEQLDKERYNYNPYVLTIIKVVKELCKRSYVNYTDITIWITKLDVEKLPNDNEIKYVNKEGRKCEYASSREFYYYQLTRAYEKLEKYQECLDLCEQALNEDLNWHYRNTLWIVARKHYCICMVSDNKEKAIGDYKKVVDKYKFWYMYHKLSSIYFRNNMWKEALLYGCMAFDIKEEDKKLLSLMYDLFSIFQANGDIEGAKKFLHACAYTRNKYGYLINYDLEYNIKLYRIDYFQALDLRLLKSYCEKTIEGITGIKHKNEGKIKRLISNGKSGFIKRENQEDIFFNISQVRNNKRPVQGDLVEFQIGKNAKGITAVNIYIKEKNYDRSTYKSK